MPLLGRIMVDCKNFKECMYDDEGNPSPQQMLGCPGEENCDGYEEEVKDVL